MDTGIVVYCIVIAILFVALAAFAAVRQQRVYNRIKDCYSSKDRTLRIDSRGKDLRPVISIRKVMDCHLGYEPEKLHYGSATVGGVTSGGFYTTGGYNKILDSKNSGKAMLELIGESSALNIALDMLSGKSQLGKAIDQIILSERLYAEAEKSNIAKYLNPETMSIGLCSKNSVNATSVTKSEISRFRSRRPLPPDPYCSAPTQPPPLAAAWPWQVIGKNAKLNRRRDTFVSEISEFRHRRRD